MADDYTPAVESFTCPHCDSKLPKKKVFGMIWRKRYTCDNCRTLLIPILNDKGSIGIIIEGFASITTIGMLILFEPIIGITAVICVLVILHTLGICSSINFLSKNIQFVEEIAYIPGGQNAGYHPLLQHDANKLLFPEIHNPILEGFMCPQCRHRLPLWKAMLLTRWTRYSCPQCQSQLSPVIHELEKHGMIFGFIGFSGGTIIPMIVRPLYGFGGVLITYAIFGILLMYTATVVCYKYTHLEIVKKQSLISPVHTKSN